MKKTVTFPCRVFPAILLATSVLTGSAAFAAELTVDTRFKTEDQGMWGSGTANQGIRFDKHSPNYPAGLLNHLDIYEEVSGVEIDANIDAGLDVSFSADPGTVDAVLDYSNGISFNFQDLAPGEWVDIALIENLNQGAIQTEFPELRLYADLVFGLDASVNGGVVLPRFDISRDLAFLGVNNPQRLIGLNAAGDGKFEVLPILQVASGPGAARNALDALDNLGELRKAQRQEEERQRDPDNLADLEDQRSEAEKEQAKAAKKEVAIRFLGAVSDAVTASARLPDVQTVNFCRAADCQAGIQAAGSDNFFELEFDVDSFLTSLKLIPPLSFEQDIGIGSVSLDLLDIGLNAGFGIAQNFSLLAPRLAKRVRFDRTVMVDVDGVIQTVPAGQSVDVEGPSFRLMWTAELASTGLAITTDHQPLATLTNRTALTGSVALGIAALSGNVRIWPVDESFGPVLNESIPLVSGEIATIFNESFALGGFGCLSGCAPQFLIDTSPMETWGNSAPEAMGARTWGDANLWQDGEVGGIGANVGRAVKINGQVSLFGQLFVDGEFEIGNAIIDREIEIFGTLRQADGNAVTSFVNNNQLWIHSGGELEVHAPISGGRDGIRQVTLGGGTLSGEIDIASHAVGGSGTIDSDTLRVQAGSVISARTTHCARSRGLDQNGDQRCIADGVVTINHSGVDAYNEGRLFASAGSRININSATGKFSFLAEASKRGILEAYAEDSVIDFGAADTRLANQDLSGDGQFTFAEILTAQNVRIDETASVTVSRLAVLGETVNNGLLNVTLRTEPHRIGDTFQPLGDEKLLNRGQLVFSSAAGESKTNIVNEGRLLVSAADPGQRAVINMENPGSLVNRGIVQVGDTAAGTTGTLIFKPGAAIHFQDGQGQYRVAADSRIEFQDVTNQVSGQVSFTELTSTDLTLEGTGTVLFDGVDIEEQVRGINNGARLTLSDKTWNSSEGFGVGESSSLILDGGSLTSAGLTVGGCLFPEVDPDLGIRACTSSTRGGTVRGEGTLSIVGDEASNRISNGGLILAEGGELVLDGRVTTNGSGVYGAGTDGVLRLGAQNFFHDGGGRAPGSLYENIVAFDTGKILLNTPVTRVAGDATVLIRDGAGGGGIFYDDCINCSDEQSGADGFLKGLEELGSFQQFLGGKIHVDSVGSRTVQIADLDIGLLSSLQLSTTTSPMNVNAGNLRVTSEAAEIYLDETRGKPLLVTFDSIENQNSFNTPSFVFGSGTLRGNSPVSPVNNNGIIEALWGTLNLENMAVVQTAEGKLSSRDGNLTLRNMSSSGGEAYITDLGIMSLDHGARLDNLMLFNSGLVRTIETSAVPGAERSISQSQVTNSGELRFAEGTTRIVATNIDNFDLYGDYEPDPALRRAITIGSLRSAATPEVIFEYGSVVGGVNTLLEISRGRLSGYGGIYGEDLVVGQAGELAAVTTEEGQEFYVNSDDLRNFGLMSATGPGSLVLSESRVSGGGEISAAADSRVYFQSVNLHNAVISGAGLHENKAGSTLTTDGTVAVTTDTTLTNTGTLSNKGSFLLEAGAWLASAGDWLQTAGKSVINGIASAVGFTATGGDLAGSGRLEGNVSLQQGATLTPGTDLDGALQQTGMFSIVGDLVTGFGSRVRMVVNSVAEFASLLVTGAMDLGGKVVFDLMENTLEVFTSTFSIGDFFKSGTPENPAPMAAASFANVDFVAKTAAGNVGLALEGEAFVAAPAPDTTPPVISGGDTEITVDSTGRLTLPPPSGAVAIDDVDGELPVYPFDFLVTNEVVRGFRPGQHIFLWVSQDSSGNAASDGIPRSLTVRPLADLPRGQVTTEGNTVTIPVRLNGLAASYPVTISYLVSGTSDAQDHDLVAGDLVIESGTYGEILVNITTDEEAEPPETLVVELDSSNEVALNGNRRHLVVIREENLAPRVRLSATQNAELTRIVTQDNGLVTVTAHATDPNNDSMAFDWSMSDTDLGATIQDNTLTFDPSFVTPGSYALHLGVTDNGAPALTTYKSLLLRVVETAPLLSADQDTDKDGVIDSLEGSGDADEDGVPDYLDAFPESNILAADSATDSTSFMQAESGIRLKLGHVAFARGSADVTVEISDLVATTPDTATDTEFEYPDGVFDFVVDEMPTEGETSSVVLPTRAPIPAGAVMRKFNPESGWQDFVIDGNNRVASARSLLGACPAPGDDSFEPGLVEGYNCIQLTLEDGGPNDLDGVINGTIVDPSAVGVQIPPPDTDGDGLNDDLDLDDDNDNVPDNEDAFPLDASESVDTDGDGIGNNADPDDDNDGVNDAEDAFPLDAGESVDTDGDGIGNNADPDDDNDGVNDAEDAFPLDASESVDTDGDGIGNNADPDDDNDDVADGADAFPLDASESVDTDGDGIGNNADPDDDNDSVNDAEDAFPLDASEAVDTDADGTGNNADTDDDNDGVVDGADAFPLNAGESVDTDGDGIGNNADPDDDNDSVNDAEDAFPLDASEAVDTDADGTGNNADTDDDNDGVADGADAFPLNAGESVDTDGDGIGNNADPDDDNDSVNDAEDAFPLDASEAVDTDADGTGNNADTDDDNDGVVDGADAFPLNAGESVDTDGDGIGNNADPDDDNDGVNDTEDAFPLDPARSATGPAARLQNLATRGLVGAGDNVLIGGFVITGTEPKLVVLRARGPSLAEFGVPDVLQNPELRLFSGGTSIDYNDNWETHVGVTFIPEDLKPVGYGDEAVIATTLPPGAYTAILSGVGETEGVGIVEVFEVGNTGETRLINIATRGYVGTGDNVLIGGLVISGSETKKVVIRAKGPSLTEQGVTGVLANPQVAIFSGGTVIAENDNWADGLDQQFIPEDLKPTNSLDAAIYMELAPGAYTAIMSGVDNGVGVGIVEVFEIQE
ncbi:MAG: hypothetical protein ACFHX7_23370 [Pseudomonadota bacterium]